MYESQFNFSLCLTTVFVSSLVHHSHTHLQFHFCLYGFSPFIMNISYFFLSQKKWNKKKKKEKEKEEEEEVTDKVII